jgi:hypothetical protein
MADQWYYAHQGQQSGPVSTEQLRQIAASGQIQPSDMVWTEGMAAWSPAHTVEGLFAGAPGPAASPPGAPPGPAPYAPQPGAYPAAKRFTLPNWSPGAWIILGSVALVLVSLFFKWTKGEGYVSGAGLLNPWVMLVGVFVYPVWMMLAGRPIQLVAGILCGAWGAITALFWILKYTVSVAGMTFCGATWGLYIYLVSCIVLVVGVILYKPTGWRLFR